MDSLIQQGLAGIEESACNDNDTSGTVTGFNVLGLGDLDELEEEKRGVRPF